MPETTTQRYTIKNTAIESQLLLLLLNYLISWRIAAYLHDVDMWRQLVVLAANAQLGRGSKPKHQDSNRVHLTADRGYGLIGEVPGEGRCIALGVAVRGYRSEDLWHGRSGEDKRT